MRSRRRWRRPPIAATASPQTALPPPPPHLRVVRNWPPDGGVSRARETFHPTAGGHLGCGRGERGERWWAGGEGGGGGGANVGTVCLVVTREGRRCASGVGAGRAASGRARERRPIVTPSGMAGAAAREVEKQGHARSSGGSEAAAAKASGGRRRAKGGGGEHGLGTLLAAVSSSSMWCSETTARRPRGAAAAAAPPPPSTLPSPAVAGHPRTSVGRTAVQRRAIEPERRERSRAAARSRSGGGDGDGEELFVAVHRLVPRRRRW